MRWAVSLLDLIRPLIDQHLTTSYFYDFFCRTKILTECVFVTQLSSNARSSVVGYYKLLFD
jgi:hypothetical protein